MRTRSCLHAHVCITCACMYEYNLCVCVCECLAKMRRSSSRLVGGGSPSGHKPVACCLAPLSPATACPPPCPSRSRGWRECDAGLRFRVTCACDGRQPPHRAARGYQSQSEVSWRRMFGLGQSMVANGNKHWRVQMCLTRPSAFGPRLDCVSRMIHQLHSSASKLAAESLWASKGGSCWHQRALSGMHPTELKVQACLFHMLEKAGGNLVTGAEPGTRLRFGIAGSQPWLSNRRCCLSDLDWALLEAATTVRSRQSQRSGQEL